MSQIHDVDSTGLCRRKPRVSLRARRSSMDSRSFSLVACRSSCSSSPTRSWSWVRFSLGVGVLGYHFIAGLNWVDALLNAAMILSGMGPVNTLDSDAAKLFASAYALFSGVAFITTTGILIAPVFHRVLHRFHIEENDLR